MAEQQPNPDELLARYTDGPAQLARVLASVTEIELDWAQESNTWTIRQFVHHLADGDALWTNPIKMALGDGPVIFELKWYWTVAQDTWAEHWKYSERSVAPSIALLSANREHVVQLLRHSPEWWERSVTIEWPDGSRGQPTIADII